MRVLVFFFLCLGFNLSQLKAQQNPCPCCTENHNAFDFWIGEWTVTTANGKPAGTSKITEIENGCVIKENWASVQAGYTGTSYNFYNTTLDRWEQLWIDNQGQHLKLNGQKSGNQMILSSDRFQDKDGNWNINRITWTANDDGSVRQLWEVLQDGKVTQVLFDGLYSKKQ